MHNLRFCWCEHCGDGAARVASQREPRAHIPCSSQGRRGRSRRQVHLMSAEQKNPAGHLLSHKGVFREILGFKTVSVFKTMLSNDMLYIFRLNLYKYGIHVCGFQIFILTFLTNIKTVWPIWIYVFVWRFLCVEVGV